MTTCALVQKWPPEAWPEGDQCGPVDVLAVGTKEQLQEFLKDYRRRLDAACGEWECVGRPLERVGRDL
jgi:hypothetical protein